IQVDSERMLVTNLSSAGGGKYNLTVTRAYNSTTAAAHAKDAPILKVTTSTPGTALDPAACTIETGAVTLSPGTYYGAICIGASDCTGTNCTPTAPYTTAAYGPAQKLFAAATSSTTSITSNGSAVSPGDIVAIDSEYLYVSATASAGGGKETL